MVADIRKYLVAVDGMEKEEARKVRGVGPKRFTVTEVREKKSGFINPVVVSFQNGTLNNDKVSGFKVSLTTNKNGETDVEVETPNGHVFRDSNCGFPRPKQIIAIKNRKTHKVKLVEVDSTLLINSALIHTPVAKEAEVDYAKDLKKLNKTFGGKKVVLRLEQREKLNVSSMPVADEVKKAVEEIKVETSNVSLNETETESILHLLPPCHRDAKLVSDVYVLNEIISEEELEELRKEVDRLAESKFNPQDFSEFYVHCYTESKKTEGNLNTRLAGVLFAEILIQFLRTPHKKLSAKRVVLCQFSSVIHDKLLNEFCVKTESTVSRPMSMRDKCLCYIIALCLICCNYKINLKLLSKCSAIHLNRLSRLARVVGAVPASKDDATFVLKLPLPALPKASASKRGRKKK